MTTPSEARRLLDENAALRVRVADLIALIDQQNEVILAHQRLNGSALNVPYRMLEHSVRNHAAGVVVERAVLQAADGSDTVFVIEDRGVGPRAPGRQGELRTWRRRPPNRISLDGHHPHHDGDGDGQ